MLGGGVAYLAAVPGGVRRARDATRYVADARRARRRRHTSWCLRPSPCSRCPSTPGCSPTGARRPRAPPAKSLNLVPFATIGSQLAAGASSAEADSWRCSTCSSSRLPASTSRSSSRGCGSWRTFLPAAIVVGASIEAAQAGHLVRPRLPLPPPRRRRLDPQHDRAADRVRGLAAAGDGWSRGASGGPGDPVGDRASGGDRRPIGPLGPAGHPRAVVGQPLQPDGRAADLPGVGERRIEGRVDERRRASRSPAGRARPPRRPGRRPATGRGARGRASRAGRGRAREVRIGGHVPNLGAPPKRKRALGGPVALNKRSSLSGPAASSPLPIR